VREVLRVIQRTGGKVVVAADVVEWLDGSYRMPTFLPTFDRNAVQKRTTRR